MDTNIRRVYIHEFFSGRMNIHDHEIIPYIEQTMDLANPRKWYNALMDYGTMLKQRCVNPNRKSAHYTRKSTFKNSNRQVRGKVLTVLLKDPLLTMAGVIQKTGMDPERVKHCVGQLIGEGFIHTKGRYFSL